ncbi:histidine-containing phosphotransfer protein 4, partial [Tanacetum coccineum]
MDQNQLKKQINLIRTSLFAQGYLDKVQFTQLEELQDDANPDFAQEVVTLFYSDSKRLISNVENALHNHPLDFGKLDDYMHQFKGSSSSIGAIKVKNECTKFQECCKARNGKGCIRVFDQVKQEHAILKRKLETYFQLEREEAVRSNWSENFQTKLREDLWYG